MRTTLIPFLCSLAALPLDLAEAVRLGIQGKHDLASRLQSRATLTGTTALNDSSNIQYATNITLGGTPFEVIIDTGRSVRCSLLVARRPRPELTFMNDQFGSICNRECTGRR